MDRVSEWKHDGIYMESDPRHAEAIVKQLSLENAVPLSVPMARSSTKGLTGEDVQELNGQDTSSYRAIVARGKYLSIDRRTGQTNEQT